MASWYLGPTGNKIYDHYIKILEWVLCKFLVCVQSQFSVCCCILLDWLPRKGTLLNLGICIIQVLKFACKFLWWRFEPKFMNPKEYGRWNQCRCIQTSCCLKSILHWKIFSGYCPIYIYIIFVCLKYLIYFLGYLVLIFTHKLLLL